MSIRSERNVRKAKTRTAKSPPDVKKNTLQADAEPEPSLHFEPGVFDDIDRDLRAWFAQTTQGAPLLASLAAMHDWQVHLAQSPGKRWELTLGAWTSFWQLIAFALDRSSGGQPDPLIEPDKSNRFRSEAWTHYPFDVYAQCWLTSKDWWARATRPMRGLNTWSSEQTAFLANSLLSAMNPANFIPTNPDLLARTLDERGANLARGYDQFLEDVKRLLADRTPENPEGFKLGKDLAATPGKVVLRTDLMELIQYAPQTKKVHATPILITPAWIMKYYILDLSPENSLVQWLVREGFTVFMISWKNPGPTDRDLGMDAFLKLGIHAALEAVQEITLSPKIHACGYCLGGTLLSIAAAQMARDGDDRLASVTLLAAQTDFSEPGDIRLLVDEAQVTFLEDMMAQIGIMPGKFMGSGFKALRPDDQIWGAAVRSYLMGDPPPLFDILVWNQDTTRMPYRMMSEYLRGLYLENRLARSRFMVDRKAVSISDIRTPIFAVGTSTDHVAPWRSVFKITRLADTSVTFVLTNGGHNAGIVSEPGHKRRHFRIGHRLESDHYLSPEAWIRAADAKEGSWWIAWKDWLLLQRPEEMITPPKMGANMPGKRPLCPAPGTYVFQR